MKTKTVRLKERAYVSLLRLQYSVESFFSLETFLFRIFFPSSLTEWLAGLGTYLQLGNLHSSKNVQCENRARFCNRQMERKKRRRNEEKSLNAENPSTFLSWETDFPRKPLLFPSFCAMLCERCNSDGNYQMLHNNKKKNVTMQFNVA